MRQIVLLAAALAAFLIPGLAQASRGVPVNIESTPPGATVYLDSAKTAPIGTTPMSRVRVARGSHTLIFKLDGFEDASLPVNIRRYRETFKVALKPLARVSVQAGNGEATGAEVRLDGQVIGTVPVETTTKPGRHLILIGKPGYDTFSQWVQLNGGQAMTLPVILVKSAPDTGSVLVSSDISGATIKVDGAPKGSSPTVIEGLSVGRHVIELSTTQPNVNPVTKEVMIEAGKRAVVNVSFRDSFAGGTLRVLCSVPGCQVSVDGEALGNAPAEKQVATGEHIVEAKAPGFAVAQKSVSIDAGRQKVVSMDLTGAPGRIVVSADADGARATVDGKDMGQVPVVIENAAPGTHAISVQAAGYETYRTTCKVGPESCEINAALKAITTRVRVVANAHDGVFYVDGEKVGNIPWEGDVAVGVHRFEVKAAGHRDWVDQVTVDQTTETRLFDVSLLVEGELTAEEQSARQSELDKVAARAMARAGHTLPENMAVLDFSIGWPYLLEARMGIGILDIFEAGFAIRTFFRLTEFEARFKMGWRPVEPISFGAQVRAGGGLGPTRGATTDELAADPMAAEHPANTAFLIVEALGTIHFGPAGGVTVWGGLDIHSDRWDWTGTNSGVLFGGVGADFGRQTTARFRVGGAVEIIFNREWNGWASFEGAFGNPRRVLGDVLGGGNGDLAMYFRLGLTYKFGY